MASSGSVRSLAQADVEVSDYADAVNELDELHFSLEEQVVEEPVPLTRKKTLPPTPGAFTTSMIPTGALPPPTPFAPLGRPMGRDTPPPVEMEPVLLLEKRKADGRAQTRGRARRLPAEDTQKNVLHLLAQPKRGRTMSETPVPHNLRIASIADVSSHLATAKTLREVAELCVAFMATRFDRVVIADARDGVPHVLASSGIVDPRGFAPAVMRSPGVQEMLVRRDAYYGAALTTQDWLAFFRALAGPLPGAVFVATLKREGKPAYVFYGDHRDLALRQDVKDTVVLLREAANAFSAVSS